MWLLNNDCDLALEKVSFEMKEAFCRLNGVFFNEKSVGKRCELILVRLILAITIFPVNFWTLRAQQCWKTFKSCVNMIFNWLNLKKCGNSLENWSTIVIQLLPNPLKGKRIQKKTQNRKYSNRLNVLINHQTCPPPKKIWTMFCRQF